METFLHKFRYHYQCEEYGQTRVTVRQLLVTAAYIMCNIPTAVASTRQRNRIDCVPQTSHCGLQSPQHSPAADTCCLHLATPDPASDVLLIVLHNTQHTLVTVNSGWSVCKFHFSFNMPVLDTGLTDVIINDTLDVHQSIVCSIKIKQFDS